MPGLDHDSEENQNQNQTQNQTQNQELPLPGTITDQNNLYASCNLPSTTIKYQSQVLGRNNQKDPPVCSVKYDRPNKVNIIKDILRNGSLTAYLKNNDKDINTLSCDLDITPSLIMIEASKGTFSNTKKLINFYKKSIKTTVVNSQ